MYAIRVFSPDFTAEDINGEPLVGSAKAFLFPIEPEVAEDFNEFIYRIFMIDNQFGYQTECPRKLWHWEAITVLSDSDIHVREA